MGVDADVEGALWQFISSEEEEGWQSSLYNAGELASIVGDENDLLATYPSL